MRASVRLSVCVCSSASLSNCLSICQSVHLCALESTQKSCIYLRHSNKHTDAMICTLNIHTDGSVVDMIITICDGLEDSRAHTCTDIQ